MKAPMPQEEKKLQIGKIRKREGQSVVLYGTGGAGKTTLCCAAPQPIAYFDLDDSLPLLNVEEADIYTIEDVRTFSDLRAALRDTSLVDNAKTIVIDSATVVDDLVTQHVLANYHNDRREHVTSLEQFGYGKGYQYVYEVWCMLIGDLEALKRKGKYVILVAHDCVTTVPNPSGPDWLRYEPRLPTTSGKSSVRYRVKDWCDHLIFLTIDILINDGKAFSSGSRTAWTADIPWAMAKSRTLNVPLKVGKFDQKFWLSLFSGGEQ